MGEQTVSDDVKQQKIISTVTKMSVKFIKQLLRKKRDGCWREIDCMEGKFPKKSVAFSF